MKFPVPCSNAVVVKKNAVLETFALKPAGSTAGGDPGKKLRVVETIATVGPAARKLHQSIARHMMTAIVFLYHCGLGLSAREGAACLVVGQLLTSSRGRWGRWKA